MYLLRKYENWRVLSALKKHPLPFSSWQSVRHLACMRHLSSVEKARLRVLCSVFMKQKVITAEQGLKLNDEMQLTIVAQACLPILKLGLNYYSAFTQVCVYPAAFWVERDDTDETGVIHHRKVLLSGESWSRGPVILSWRDIKHDLQHGDEGHNVVIHEFAHKIDMLNRGANGMPPVASGSSSEEWHSIFQQAYNHLRSRLQDHHQTCINQYGASSPTEFFAVVSEYFFTAPQHLSQCYPGVYHELKLFYQQNPALSRISQ